MDWLDENPGSKPLFNESFFIRLGYPDGKHLDPGTLAVGAGVLCHAFFLLGPYFSSRHSVQHQLMNR
jgi:hypothetical protein